MRKSEGEDDMEARCSHRVCKVEKGEGGERVRVAAGEGETQKDWLGWGVGESRSES